MGGSLFSGIPFVQFPMADSSRADTPASGRPQSANLVSAKGAGKTIQTGQQAVPSPVTQSASSSSSWEPLQTPTLHSVTDNSHTFSFNHHLDANHAVSGPEPPDWFLSSIPETAPAAAVFTDDDLFDEPDEAPPIQVRVPVDWPPLPDTSSSSS